jgi:hypothetical protein
MASWKKTITTPFKKACTFFKEQPTRDHKKSQTGLFIVHHPLLATILISSLRLRPFTNFLFFYKKKYFLIIFHINKNKTLV